MYLSTDISTLHFSDCLDVQLSCCHTSLFVTYALRGVTSQQENRLTVLVTAMGDRIPCYGIIPVTLQMSSAETSTQLIDP